MVTLFLSIKTIQVLLLRLGSRSLLILNLVHKLLDLCLETFLELFLHLCVFLEFLSGGRYRDLQLFAAIFTLPDELLALTHVVFEVVVHLQFLVQRNQRIQFVFQFHLALLQRNLQLFIPALIKVGLRQTTPH